MQILIFLTLYTAAVENGKSGAPVSSNAVSSNRRWMMYKMTKASQERADQVTQESSKVNEKVCIIVLL